jgi:hypothetical protein
MASIYADYDDMPELEEIHSAPEKNATPVAAPAPSCEPIHATASVYEDYDDMPDLEQAQAAPSAISIPPTHDAQDDESAPLSSFLPSGPSHSFLVLAQVLIAVGSLPGLEAAMSAEAGNVPAALGGLFSMISGDDDEDEDEEADTSESEIGDEHDDMPSLENAVPSTTLPPLGLHASIYVNMAQSGTYTLESLMLASQGLGNPLGSLPSPPPASTTPSNGNEGNQPASAPTVPTQNTPTSSPNGVPQPSSPMPFNFASGPSLALGPDGAPIDNAGLTYNFITATSIGEFAAELEATGVSEQHIAQVTSVLASMAPGVLPPFPPVFGPPRRPPFDAVAFVDTLEQVDISTIPEEDLKCPHCWLPFGTTDEDDPTFMFDPDADESPELAARQIALHEMPFCEARPDNNPVRTPCGHLFGKSCLIETIEKVDTLCPTCRKELRPKPEVPDATE